MFVVIESEGAFDGAVFAAGEEADDDDADEGRAEKERFPEDGGQDGDEPGAVFGWVRVRAADGMVARLSVNALKTGTETVP